MLFEEEVRAWLPNLEPTVIHKLTVGTLRPRAHVPSPSRTRKAPKKGHDIHAVKGWWAGLPGIQRTHGRLARQVGVKLDKIIGRGRRG